MSRRHFIRMGGAVAGGLALTGLVPGAAEAAAASPLPVDADAIRKFANPVPLASTTVMQSFAIDHANRHIYTAQLLASSDPEAGDITLTKLSLDNGSKVEPIWIHLRNFGHATAMGVEPVAAVDGGGARIWIETSVESTTNKSPIGGAIGYGTKIACLHMGGTAGFQKNDNVYALTADNSQTGPYYEVFDPRPDYGQKSIAIDRPNNLVSLRYRADTGQSKRIVHELFDLDAFKSHTYNKISKVTLDYSVFQGLFDDTVDPVFQGHTTFGDYFYVLTGEGNKDNQRLWSFKWETDAVNPEPHDVALSGAGSGYSYHEPEGMSVHQYAPDDYRLMFGVATGETGSREAMFYYK